METQFQFGIASGEILEQEKVKSWIDDAQKSLMSMSDTWTHIRKIS